MKIEKKKDKEEIIEGEEVKTAWDFKKIAVGAVVLASLFIIGSYIFMPRQSGTIENSGQGTLGVSSSNKEEIPPLPKQEDIEKIINNAQNTLSNISSENLTSSQAAIQKVITDLQKLQENSSPGDIFCEFVCKK